VLFSNVISRFICFG